MSRIVTVVAAFFPWIILMSPLSAQDESELAPRGLEGETEGRLPFGKREPVVRAEVDDSVVLVPNLARIKLTGSNQSKVL